MNDKTRVRVQGCPSTHYVSGTIEWWEHVRAWKAYAIRYGPVQSAQEIMNRGGFSLFELTEQLGYTPVTYKENK